MVDDSHAPALARVLERSYMEVFPARGIEEGIGELPPRSYVAITCSPKKGIETTLDMTERLVAEGYRVIPHVTARLVVDEAHLGEILARLSALEIEYFFVPAGDSPEPVGKFSSAVQLLEAMAEIDHTIREVGVTGYPEGHPKVDDAALLEALLAKQPYASYVVTQMCFDAGRILRWLREIRSFGVRLPVWIGLPGVGERAKLFRTALRIGVGESAHFLKTHKELVGQMIRPGGYTPDQLLHDLAPGLEDESYGIAGFHLYSFNQVRSTEAWREACLAELRTPSLVEM